MIYNEAEVPLAVTEIVPIRYTLVEQSQLLTRGTAFHLLSQAEYELQRCFMTLLQLPTNTQDLQIGRPPFLAAVSRASLLPRFRKAENMRQPPRPLWEDLQTSPLVLIMVGHDAPIWLESLASRRDVAVLTPSETLFQSLTALPRVHAGLLKGFEDLRESYRVLAEMILAATAGQFGANAAVACRELITRDIFATRMRLDFIPALPLPPPDRGRPAAYLLNRLSNNLDEPTLAPDYPADGLTSLPNMFDRCLRGCAALAVVEMKEPVPSYIHLSEAELKVHSSAITDGKVGPDERLRRLWQLGDAIAAQHPIQRPFFVIPVPRHDLVKGKGPESVTVDPHNKKEMRAAIQAVKDFTEHRDKRTLETVEETVSYQRAWGTLETEQRLISCQTAWLSAGSHTIPIQMSIRPAALYRALNVLNSALESNSRKIPTLFQSVELLLAETLPDGMLKHLDEGDSPVTFFSDLPFEWTLLDNWPVCLTRPVARIPVGLSHWDVLTAALEGSAYIDTHKPERVLVLSLLEATDPVRRHSDAFASVSESLAQRYTYVTPKNAREFRDVLANAKADVVVLDAHGGYDGASDQLFIEIGGSPCPVHDLLPDAQVPPVWVLSACNTSVTGAMRGCFVRALLARGALCVVAGLSRVDAFTASMFVGRLLTDIFNPPTPGLYDDFQEVFFATQYTTALLYDPLLPFFRLAERDTEVRRRLGLVLSDFLGWHRGHNLDVRKYRHEIAWFVGEAILRHGLQNIQISHLTSGIVRPETLLFSVFGAPGHVQLR